MQEQSKGIVNVKTKLIVKVTLLYSYDESISAFKEYFELIK